MPIFESSVVADSITVAVGIAAYRAVPFVGWTCLSPEVSLRSRCLVLALFAVVLCGLWMSPLDVSEILLRAPVAMTYFASLALLVYECRSVGRTRAGRAALGGAIGLGYVVVPGVTIGGAVLIPTLVMGLDMALGAFSFVVSASACSSRRAEAAFFLLVDPSLVFEDRAVRAPRRTDPGHGSGRVAVGIAKLALHHVYTASGIAAMLALGSDARVLAPHHPSFAVVHLALLAALFLAHSGLADIQIGFLRFAGFAVSERYDRPYLATSPADFWRRWNVWLGRWAHRHIYVPAARAGLRTLPWSMRRGAIALGVIAAFTVTGLLHDVIPWLVRAKADPRDFRPFAAALFLVMGCLVVVWELVRRELARGLARLGWTLEGRGIRILRWTAFAYLAAAATYASHPILTGHRLPRAASRAVAWLLW